LKFQYRGINKGQSDDINLRAKGYIFQNQISARLWYYFSQNHNLQAGEKRSVRYYKLMNTHQVKWSLN